MRFHPINKYYTNKPHQCTNGPQSNGKIPVPRLPLKFNPQDLHMLYKLPYPTYPESENNQPRQTHTSIKLHRRRESHHVVCYHLAPKMWTLGKMNLPIVVCFLLGVTIGASPLDEKLNGTSIQREVAANRKLITLFLEICIFQHPLICFLHFNL